MTFFDSVSRCQILPFVVSALACFFAFGTPGFCIPVSQDTYSPVQNERSQAGVNMASFYNLRDNKWKDGNGEMNQGQPISVPGSAPANSASDAGQNQTEQQESVPCKTCGDQSCGGGVDPFGKYAFSGQSIGGAKAGQCPNPSYSQAPCNKPPQCATGALGAQITQASQVTNGLPMSNAQGVASVMNMFHAFSNNVNDVQSNIPAMKAAQQAQAQQASDNQGQCCQNNCQTAFQYMMVDLINVANEGAAIPTLADVQYKTLPQAVWMVQRMYKHCYIPMAILFILPGAILTQLKSLIHFQILGGQSEETVSPFTGIFRSIMAIFLIPCTQLIVSYCIDIGNSLTFPVRNYVVLALLEAWVEDQAFVTKPQNIDNYIRSIPGGARNQGKISNSDDDSTIQERQGNLTSSVQNFLNTVNSFVSQGLTVLNAFQIVMVCYLFLLGPIAAAFYAWPSGIGRDLFKKTFSNWMDGLVVLCLWKFWWCIVLLCMVLRLQSGAIQPTNQFEMYYFTAFMGILVFVPFQPFDFRPGEIISQVLEKAQQATGGGGGGAGGGSGGGSGGGGNNTSMNSSGSKGGNTTNNSAMQSSGQIGGANVNPGQTNSAPGSGSSNDGGSRTSTSNTSSPSAGEVKSPSPKDVKEPPSSEKGKKSSPTRSAYASNKSTPPPTA